MNNATAGLEEEVCPARSSAIRAANALFAQAGRAFDPDTNGADKAHWADKVDSVDAINHSVKYDITNGCYEDRSVHYVSFDASLAGPAAIEDVTYASALETFRPRIVGRTISTRPDHSSRQDAPAKA